MVRSGAVVLAVLALAPVAHAADAGRFVGLSAQMTSARAGHVSVTLADGRVLLAAGFTNTVGTAGNTAEVFNPATNTFSPLAGKLTASRTRPVAARLADGRVLVASGAGGSKSAEIFNPATNTFSPIAATLGTARVGGVAATLPDGRVLIAGGTDGQTINTATATAEIFNPAGAGSFAPIAEQMNDARDAGAAVALNDGRVLIAGGRLFNGDPLASAEVFTPSTGKFTTVGAMGTARYRPAMALLPDGRAIVAGGQDADLDIVASAEVFDPVSNTFSPLEGISGEMTTTRYGAQGASLPDGRVLITGGFEFNDTTTSAEVFERGPEPVLTGDGGFGAQVVGSTSASRTFTVANAGVSRLEVADVRISGDARDDFAVDDGCDGAQLAPGQSCSVTATFSPTDLGARAANLAVIDNAPSHVQRIALSGSGVPFSAPAPAAPVPTPTPAAPAKPKTLTLSCALKKKSARRALACTATPPVKGQKVSSLTLRLTRAGRTLARGSAFGPKLTLRARRALKPGRYTLRAIVTIGSQATTLTKALVLR